MESRNKLYEIIYLLCLFFVTASLVRWNYYSIFKVFSPILFHKRISVIALEILFALIPFFALYIALIRSISIVKGRFLLSDKSIIHVKVLRSVGVVMMASGLVITLFTIGQTIVTGRTVAWLVVFASLWKIKFVGIIFFEMSRLVELEERYYTR